MGTERHIADGETSFVILNVTPDFCQVGNCIVAFDISQTLKPEEADYAKSAFAHSAPVLLIGSIIDQVKGNAGSGVGSGVALGGGNSRIIEGSDTVYIESRRVARHNDLVEMNGKVG